MGSQVLYYFFAWVEAEGYGNGGPNWVNDHIHSWINISGCMLGALKGLPAVLSGEMKDTAQLNAFAVYGLEKFLSREERAELFRAMPGISSMLPKGGDLVWGYAEAFLWSYVTIADGLRRNSTWAPDDMPGQHDTFGNFISFKHVNGTSISTQNLTVEASMEYLLNNTEPWYHKQLRGSYSHGVAHTTSEVERNQKDARKWINPLETRLPIAPDLKIFCFYGMGKATERSYFYRDEPSPLIALNVTIDTSVTSGEVDHGVMMGEGDGTVSLLSVGYMCSRGWKLKRFNPGGVQVTTYEMPHEPDRFSPRGGPNTGKCRRVFLRAQVLTLPGDHVDILGRSSLNDLILRVAGGQGHLIEEHYASNIREYSNKVKIFEE